MAHKFVIDHGVPWHLLNSRRIAFGIGFEIIATTKTFARACQDDDMHAIIVLAMGHGISDVIGHGRADGIEPFWPI